MQFRQVGKRIQVLAPMWDSEAKRTRQRLVYSFPADDPPIAHSVDIKALDGLDRDAAATEINDWNAARRKEIQDERSNKMTYIVARSVNIYKSIDPLQPIDAEGWQMDVSIYNDETTVLIRRDKKVVNNVLTAFINIEIGNNNARVLVKDKFNTKFENNNMKIVEAIEECNALFEYFDG